MRAVRSILSLLILATALQFSSCKRDPEDPEGESFNKEEMLGNIGSNVIIAAYDQLELDAKELGEAITAFESSQSTVNLASLRTKTIEAYQSLNACSVFEFGPAADENFRLALNTFPTDTAQIEVNISAGSYDLNAAQNADAIGFPALDYLLFWPSDVNQAVTQFEGSGNARLAYLKANADLISEKVSLVRAAWNAYSDEFKTNTASSVGSPIGMLVNQINFEFELLKNARLGIPLGKKTLGVTQVGKLEGYYSDESRKLLLANLDGIQSAFTGGSGSGLDDYLNALGAKRDSENLSEAINDGFEEIRSNLAATSFKAAIESDPSQLEPAYDAIEQLVVLLKTDMPSQLGVQITYQDNDGD